MGSCKTLHQGRRLGQLSYRVSVAKIGIAPQFWLLLGGLPEQAPANLCCHHPLLLLHPSEHGGVLLSAPNQVGNDLLNLSKWHILVRLHAVQTLGYTRTLSSY